MLANPSPWPFSFDQLAADTGKSLFRQLSLGDVGGNAQRARLAVRAQQHEKVAGGRPLRDDSPGCVGRRRPPAHAASS